MEKCLITSGLLSFLALGGLSVCYFLYARDPSFLIAGGAFVTAGVSFLPK